MLSDVRGETRHAARPTLLRRVDVPLVSLALGAILACLALVLSATLASAAGTPADAARETARRLVSETTGTLAGGTIADPVLVRDGKDRGPAYFVVPVRVGDRIAGIVGITADGRSWQWYNESYDKPSFPLVGEAAAQRALGGEAVLVTGRDSRLYWTTASGDGHLLSADTGEGGQVRASAQDAPASAVRDTRPGSFAGSGARDPARGDFRIAATESTLPAFRDLSMPHYYQLTSYYCGPASLQMLFDYYNPKIESQYDIANVMQAKVWDGWSGAYADDLVRTVRFSNQSRAIMDSSLQGFKERTLGYSALSNFWSDGGSADPDYATRYTDLKTLVNAGQPVLLLTWYDGEHKAGHFRIVKGYDDAAGTFIVHDPWYTAPFYGPDVRFRQSFLVDDLWTRYSRWGVTVAPWRVAVTAPAEVSAGKTFTVSASVRYVGLHPMEGRSAVADSRATLQLPPGFSVSSPTLGLPNVTSSGTAQTVSWTVTAPSAYDGDVDLRVVARGTYTGQSTSYGTYTDDIGGAGGRAISVVGAATANSAPTLGTLDPQSSSSRPGEWRTIKTTYSDANGVSDLRTVSVLVNGRVAGENALYAAYSSYSNNLYLRRADNSAWLEPVQLGSAGILDNGYARLDASRTTVGRSGNDLTVSWVLSPGERMSGALHNVYLEAQDTKSALAPWTNRGQWVVNRPATAGPVQEAGGVARTGMPTAINSSYSDPDGLGDVQTGQLMVNTQLAGAGSVWLRYDALNRKLYLRNADNTGWLGPITAGVAGRLDNGRAVLDGASTKVSRTDSALHIRWGVVFSQSFSGREYNLYSVASDRATSEFSLPWVGSGTYSVSAVPRAVEVSPAAGRSVPGARVTHIARYRDADGAGHIREALLLVNTRVAGVSAVYALYNPQSNKLYLRDDANTGWLGGLTPGGSGTVSNAQATLVASGTAVSRSGTDLVVRWSLLYQEAYSGKVYNAYLTARDAAGVAGPWTRLGTWTVNRVPVTTSVSPRNSSSHSGAATTYAATYGDGDGAGNLLAVRYLVNSTATWKNGVSVSYNVRQNRLYMQDAEGHWIGGVAPGASRKVSTTYGTLDAAKTTVSRSGDTITVQWNLTFASGMRNRTLYQYLYASDLAGGLRGYTAMGSWKVS